MKIIVFAPGVRFPFAFYFLDWETNQFYKTGRYAAESFVFSAILRHWAPPSSQLHPFGISTLTRPDRGASVLNPCARSQLKVASTEVVNTEYKLMSEWRFKKDTIKESLTATTGVSFTASNSKAD
ncbi:MAG: hypothetical protein ABIU63_09670 [Chitinophagaceae bacterium]